MCSVLYSVLLSEGAVPVLVFQLCYHYDWGLCILTLQACVENTSLGVAVGG